MADSVHDRRVMARTVKRGLDVAGALLLFIPALLLTLILLIAIRLESAGPPLFVQQRVGRGQRPFLLLKLRTMAAGTPHLASHLVGATGITRLGRVLRLTKLDELPQLWNVLIGEMSFVGPRPCLFSQHDLVTARARAGAFAVRPGITGPAQIAGVDMSEPERLALIDGNYAKTFTIAGDLLIALRTVSGRGSGDAARHNPTRPR